MNIALPALIIFFLLSPGFIVRTNLKKIERTSLDYSPFGRVVSEAMLWSCLCHFIWLSIAHWIFDRTLDVSALVKILSSDGTGQAKAADTIAAHFNWVAFYFGSLFFSAYWIPNVVRWSIKRCRLDRNGAQLSSLFRFHEAPWYYLLTGADFTKDNEPDFIGISAIVDVAGQPMLYTGLLDEFFIDPEGQLDRLVLRQVMRRPLEKDKNSEENSGINRFYAIDGDYFVLRYRETITLNVEYHRIETHDVGENNNDPAAMVNDIPAEPIRSEEN